ncbi:MAG TPA: PilZ domain-containing protein [Bryobacteraceae bacterium]|nr:PilZ domain-containing protein [Bryobacteraceae bacterium]
MSSMERKADRRRQPRDPLSVALSILCTDHEGRETVMHAKLLDISVSGARLSILQRIAPHSAITFYYHKLAIGGRGTVRFCRTGKKGYEVGIEFPNGTGWSPAQREKADLLSLGAAITHEQPVSSPEPVEVGANDGNP